MRLIIKAEPLPGDTIHEASKEAVKLAVRLGCIVELNFNGIVMLISETNTDNAEIVLEYYERLERELCSNDNSRRE